MNFDIRAISRILGVFKAKKRDKTCKQLVKTLEIIADTTNRSQVITEKRIDRHGKLTSSVYKLHHKECRKTLKLVEVKEYLGNNDVMCQSTYKIQHS